MSVDSVPQRSSEARWPAVRAWLGVVVALAGVFLLWLGWYEVAGETLVARQLPFLASASIPGAALLLAGVVLIGTEISRRSTVQAQEMVGALYRLLTEEMEPPDTAAGGAQPAADASVVAVAGGTRYHRRDCPLVEGKPDVETVGAGEVARRALQPCPVCVASPPGG